MAIINNKMDIIIYFYNSLRILHKLKQMWLIPTELSINQRIRIVIIIMVLASHFAINDAQCWASCLAALAVGIEAVALGTVSHEHPAACIHVSIYWNVLGMFIFPIYYIPTFIFFQSIKFLFRFQFLISFMFYVLQFGEQLFNFFFLQFFNFIL